MATAGGFSIGGPGPGSLVLRMEVEGFAPVKVSLQRFGERVRDFRPFWVGYFAPAFYREVTRNFETEGSYVGGWAALSPDYATWKAAHYPGKGILRRTDALFRSLTFDGASPGAEGVFVADRESLVIGTAVPYAQYHQRGTSRMLRRAVLFLGQQTRSSMGRLLHRFAVDAADQAGLDVAAARARGVSSGLL